MLHLDAGVHFHEVEMLARLIDEVFDRAGVLVVDRLDEIHGSRAHALAHFRGEKGRGAFLDDLLVAALHRAIALAEVDEMAVGIGNDLELDVVRVEHQFLHVTIAISEAGHGLVRSGLEKGLELLRLEAGAHPASAAAGRSLDHHRQADLHRFRVSLVGIRQDFRSGSDRHAVRDRSGAGGGLVAHHPDHIRRGADENDAGALADIGEAGVF